MLVDINSVPPTTDSEGNATLWPFMFSAFAKNAGHRAVGWRKLLKREMEADSKGKKFEKLTYAPAFDFWTFQELKDAAAALGAGLVVKTGMKPGDKVLIFAETQRDWMVAALAIFRQGGIVVTAYATLGEEGVVTSLNQTEATTCVCDAKLFKTYGALRRVLADVDWVCHRLRVAAHSHRHRRQAEGWLQARRLYVAYISSVACCLSCFVDRRSSYVA